MKENQYFRPPEKATENREMGGGTSQAMEFTSSEFIANRVSFLVSPLIREIFRKNCDLSSPMAFLSTVSHFK